MTIDVRHLTNPVLENDSAFADKSRLAWIQAKVEFCLSRFLQEDCLIHVIDDDPLVRSSLQFLLRSEGWRSFAWANAEDFLEKPRPIRPGCIILDVQLGGMTGPDLQAKLEKIDPDFPICFISAHGEMNLAVHTMRHHAIDFMPKPVDDERLLENVKKGAISHWQVLVKKLCRSALQNSWNELTGREREVALLIAQGTLNKQIAEQLNISENTVQTHRTACFRKLNVRTSFELARIVDSIR